MIGKVHLTKQYARYRLRDPREFSAFRTKDVGRVGHTKIVVGKLRKGGQWVTQSILVNRNDYEKGLRVAFTQTGRPVMMRIHNKLSRMV
jgi:hypothetical protein